jgi:hypothetical protein
VGVQVYRLCDGLLQPHWQLFSAQLHASTAHPQEQLSQSQVPQQVESFFKLDISFSFKL